MKRKFRLITALTILITLLFNNNVFAEDKVYVEGTLMYTISEDGNITIVDYCGKEENVKVPMSIGMHYVTKIAEGSFKDTNVKSVELPDTITSISSEAFDNIGSIEITYFDSTDAQVEIQDPIEYPPLQPEIQPEKPSNPEVKPEQSKQEENTTNEDGQDVAVIVDSFEEDGEEFTAAVIDFEQAQEDDPPHIQEETKLDTSQENTQEVINQNIPNVEKTSNLGITIGVIALGVIVILLIKKKAK